MSRPTCNNWTPSFVCSNPLTTAKEVADGCCRTCAASIDAALKRNLDAMPTYRRRVAEEAGPDLAAEAVAAVDAMLDADPSLAF